MTSTLKTLSVAFFFFITACSTNAKKEKTEESNKNNPSSKIEELLKLLNVELFDECVSFPSFIENPYQEFENIPAKGGLFFDGTTGKCNKQYSFYATKRDLNAFHLSWKTETGEINHPEISSYKLTDNTEIPFLKTNWLSTTGNNTAELNIIPVLEHKDAPEYSGTIQYALFTKYWRIIGFRKLPESDFYEILRRMGEIKGIKTDRLKIKKKGGLSDVNQNEQTKLPMLDKSDYTISDPDGYTNVRSEKSSDSEILFQIKEGNHFTVISKEGSWWEIVYQGRKGFIHKSRIKRLE